MERCAARCLVVWALCLAAPLALRAEARADAGVTAITTYLRIGPGRQYAVLDEIGPGRRLEIQSCQGDWCRVASPDASGYVEAKALHLPDIHANAPQRQAGSDCFTAVLNGTASGDRQRFCTR
jgi:uncharacterized protein YraI